MDSKKENLRELIEKFMDPKNARMYLEDIEAGERILREHPTPRPDDMLLANIKANMAMHKLPQRTVTFRKRVYEVIAVAASIIIIATISLHSFYQTPPIPPGEKFFTSAVLSEKWWTNEDEAYLNIIDNYKKINTQFAQIEIEVDSYNNDTLALDEFQNQIQKVQDRMVSMESGVNTPIDFYSNPSSTLEEIENKLNELSGNFWKDDYNITSIYE